LRLIRNHWRLKRNQNYTGEFLGCAFWGKAAPDVALRKMAISVSFQNPEPSRLTKKVLDFRGSRTSEAAAKEKQT